MAGSVVYESLAKLKESGLVKNEYVREGVSVQGPLEPGRRARKTHWVWKATGISPSTLLFDEFAGFITSPPVQVVENGRERLEHTTERMRTAAGGWLITQDNTALNQLAKDGKFNDLSAELENRLWEVWIRSVQKSDSVEKFEEAFVEYVKLYEPAVHGLLLDLGEYSPDGPVPFPEAIRYTALVQSAVDEGFDVVPWTEHILDLISRMEELGKLECRQGPGRIRRLRRDLRRKSKTYDEYLKKLVPPKTLLIHPMSHFQPPYLRASYIQDSLEGTEPALIPKDA